MDILTLFVYMLKMAKSSSNKFLSFFSSLVPKRMNEMKEVVISLSYQIYYFSLPYFCEKNIFLVYALVRTTIAVMNNHDQRQLEEERVYMAYILDYSHREGSQPGGNLEAEADSEPMAECCLLACVLFYRTQDYQPREVPDYRVFGPPPLIIN